MRPIDIVATKRDNLNGYSADLQIWDMYHNEDCVIAYRKCFLGDVILIKGRREMFGFLISTKPASRWGICELNRKDLRDIIKLFEEPGEDKLVILNDKEYKIFGRKVLFKGLMDKNGR